MDLRKKRYVLMFFMGMLYSSQNVMPWFSTYYYKAMQGALNYTDGQLGTLISVFGVVAVVMYIIAGILSDRFALKPLLLISSFGTGGLILLMAMLPAYPVMLAIQIGFALTVIGTFYGAFVKFTHTLGNEQEQGKMYGFMFAFNGLLGMLLGFIASGIYAALSNTSDVTAFRYMLYVYAAFNMIPGVVLCFFYNEKKDTYMIEEDQNEKFQFNYLSDVLKMPEVWLIAVMGFCAYTFKCSASYFTPYLTDAFAIPVVVMNFIVIIRSYGVRIIMNPISGFFIDKIHSATHVMAVDFILGIIVVGTTLLLPSGSAFAMIAVALLILVAAIYNLSVPCRYTPITEARIPNKYYGTVVGITSAIAFSPDAFFYLIGGRLLDHYGGRGYTYIFLIVLGIVILGVMVSLKLKRMIQKKNDLIRSKSDKKEWIKRELMINKL